MLPTVPPALPDPALPRPARPGRIRTVWTLLALLGAAACGGGGGGAAPTVAAGIQGTVLLSDVDLGRLIEQEPNDGAGQVFRLPPAPPRTRMEVTGEIGVTSARYGRADPTDVHRFSALEAQDVAVTLTFGSRDPVDGGENLLSVRVVDPGTGETLADSLVGPTPRATALPVGAGQDLDVVVAAADGHAPYVLAFALFDPSAPTSPDPPALTSPDPVLASLPAAAPGIPVGEDFAPDHLLVRLREGADPAVVAARLGVTPEQRTGTGSHRFRVPDGATHGTAGRPRSIPGWRVRLEEDPDVLWAEPDWVVRPLGLPDDPDLARQWNLQAIGAPGAWETTRGDRSVVVGIVDTGIVPHPDLEGQVAEGYDFVSTAIRGADGDGRDSDPRDPGDRGLYSGLSSWHGTHVAGIVAGRAGDGHGIVGVAPGCRVMPLRAVGVGGGLVSDVSDAILFAAGLLTTSSGRKLDAPLRVVNLSFGLSQDSSELREACQRAANMGVLLVGAAGNTGQHILYPARYDTVFAVGAVDGLLDKAAYSSFGSELDLCAPGGLGVLDVQADGWPDGILSAMVDETVKPATFAHGYLEGTSQAAPHVAGAAALLFSVDPTLTAEDARLLLTASALDRGQVGRDDAYGWGVLQVGEALRRLAIGHGTPNPAPPALGLSVASLPFAGFEGQHRVVVQNLGGGELRLGDPLSATDDGRSWLGAWNDLPLPGAGSTVGGVTVVVDRTLVPRTDGVYSGSVIVRDEDGLPLGSIRVVMYVNVRLRAGLNAMVTARDASSGAVVSYGISSPASGYRYWFPYLAPGAYKVMAGTDVDGDGFICEGGDFCGWFGGATEEDAAVVEVAAEIPVLGADVYLQGP